MAAHFSKVQNCTKLRADNSSSCTADCSAPGRHVLSNMTFVMLLAQMGCLCTANRRHPSAGMQNLSSSCIQPTQCQHTGSQHNCPGHHTDDSQQQPRQLSVLCWSLFCDKSSSIAETSCSSSLMCSMRCPTLHLCTGCCWRLDWHRPPLGPHTAAGLPQTGCSLLGY
jgi:hypothetical protein